MSKTIAKIHILKPETGADLWGAASAPSPKTAMTYFCLSQKQFAGYATPTENPASAFEKTTRPINTNYSSAPLHPPPTQIGSAPAAITTIDWLNVTFID